MRRIYRNCAYCNTKIEMREWTQHHPHRESKIKKIINGYVITNLLNDPQIPVCNKHYGIIVKILTSKEMYFRNDKGQIQRV